MNGIKIVVTEGETVDGKTEYFFPDTKDSIVLGRDPQRCDIVFSQQLRERGVGSEHLALRRALGRYRLALNTENAVSVDGTPAFDEQEVVRSAVLKLDRGATLRVEIVDERPQTVAHDRPREQLGREVASARKWVRPAVAAAAVVVGVIVFMLWRQDRMEGAALQAVPAAVITKTTQSVYMVLVRGRDGGENAVGTAWVGPGGRVFTNAHVAEVFNQVPQGTTMLIRRATSPHRDHRVTGVLLHPGYELFAKTATAYEPAERQVSSSKRLELIPIADVALMQVDDKGELAPPLQLLPEARAESLGAGEPIAFVGFPSEGLIAGTAKNPVPISQKAQIINVTDSFLTHRTQGQNRLVLHSLPATGGASGSPIVNTAGQVVAVLNAGNIVMVGGKRTPSAAAVNFAQRVDYVYDMLDSGRLKARTELYEREWQEGLKRFDRSQDLELKVALDAARNQLGAKGEPQMVEVKRAFRGMDPKMQKPAERFPVQLEPGLYIWFAVPGKIGDLDMKLFDARKKEIAKDERGSQFALVRHEATSRQEVEVLLFQDTPKLDPDLQYTLQTYFWPASSLASVENRWIRRAKERMRTDADPVQIFSRQDLSTGSASQGDNGESMFDVRMPGPGQAMFLAIPADRAEMAVILKSGTDVIARGTSDDGSPAALLAAVGEGVRETEVVVLSQRPGAKFQLKGYHWGPPARK